MLHPVGKQVYNLELPKKWKIHNVFHVSLVEQNINKKGRVSKKVPELDAGNKNNKKYKLEAIWDSAVYANKLKSSHLPGFYYLVAWKDYPKEKNTWEPSSAVQHLKKLISSFHKDYSKKPTITSLPIDFTPPIARPTVKPTAKAITKQKRGRPANSLSKQAKNWIYTDSHNNQPLIRWGLDCSSFSAKFFIFSNLIFKASVFFLKTSY